MATFCTVCRKKIDAGSRCNGCGGGEWRDAEYRSARRHLIAHHDGVCQECGGTDRGEVDPWTIDHIVSRRDGGTHALTNLRVIHRSCNSSKGSR